MELKIGAALIIWGKRVLEDLPVVLDETASMNYQGIETSPDVFEKVKDTKELLTKRGLSLAGLHLGFRDIDKKAVGTTLDILQRMDGHYLLFSGAGGKENTQENYRRAARFLGKTGKESRDYGIKVCYHNHWQETVNGALGTRVICEETDPEHVSLCVDTFWVQYAGLSPVKFIKEHSDRVAYLHLKDGIPEDMKVYRFLELGRRTVNFPLFIETVKFADIE